MGSSVKCKALDWNRKSMSSLFFSRIFRRVCGRVIQKKEIIMGDWEKEANCQSYSPRLKYIGFQFFLTVSNETLKREYSQDKTSNARYISALAV